MKLHLEEVHLEVWNPFLARVAAETSSFAETVAPGSSPSCGHGVCAEQGKMGGVSPREALNVVQEDSFQT